MIDDDDNAIEVFDHSFPYNYVGQFGASDIDEPECIAVGNNRVFVAELFEEEIDVFQIGKPIPTLSQWGLIILGLCLSIAGIVALKNVVFLKIRSR